VDISVQQLAALQMLELVSDGRLDCALVSLVSEQVPGLEVVPLLTEPLVLACAPAHRLAGRPGVGLDELDGERFVEPPTQWAIRALVDQAFQEAGLTRRIACEVNEWTMVLDLVGAGAGIALVPDGVAFPSGAGLALIPLTGVELMRRVDLVLPRGHAATPAARRFLEYVVPGH
jgi:DNA-binding transcriptional LysR family regulator